MKNSISRRNFLVSSTALAAVAGCTTAKPSGTPAAQSAPEQPISAESGIRVRFLGSGAAGWRPEMAKNPNARRQSSVLLENKVLIDFTMCAFDMLPKGCRPEVLFHTHSHGDHYNPNAAVKSSALTIQLPGSAVSAALPRSLIPG